MSDTWQHQLRVTLSEHVAERARHGGDHPALGPLYRVLADHDAALRCQFDAFAEFVAEAEKAGATDTALYRWTKDTIRDPAKQAKHLRSFTVYAGGREVYAKETADALERDLKALVGGEAVEHMARHDTNPANNPQPPARYQK